MTCRYCQGDHNQRVTVDRELLIQLEDFLDDRADVMDGDYGEPRPNRAMQLLQDVRAVLEGSSEGTGAILHPVSPLSSFSTTGAEEPSGTTPTDAPRGAGRAPHEPDTKPSTAGTHGPSTCAALEGDPPAHESERCQAGDTAPRAGASNPSRGLQGGPLTAAVPAGAEHAGSGGPFPSPPANTVPPVADLGKPANASLPEPAARPQEGGSAPTCSRCRGTGEETHHEGGDEETDWCSDCGGTGEPLLPDYVTPLRKLAAELGVKK